MPSPAAGAGRPTFLHKGVRHPDELVVHRLALEPEGAALLRMVADLVHGIGVEEAAVDHDKIDVLRLPQVLQRIPVDHDEVGELTLLQRSEVAVQSEVLSAV